MTGFLTPTSGSIHVCGIALSQWQNPIVFRRKVQWLSQEASYAPRRTVESLLGEVITVHGLSKSLKDVKEKSIRALNEVALSEEILSRYPWQLSGGERQRLQWARALLLDPGLVVLDEPTSHLDPVNTLQLLDYFASLRKMRKLSCLWITHQKNVIRRLQGRVLTMDKVSISEERVPEV